MNFSESVLKNEEKGVFLLRELYQRYGYRQYKMSKFEEYDLYAANKAFLTSDNIITFTDTNGRLMALKPDVTLSIVRNTKDTPGYVHKVFYDENVYRVPKGAHAYKEILQTGLECIGEIDRYDLQEVLFLAAQSLACLTDRYMLNISHLGLVESLLQKAGLGQDQYSRALHLIGEKNMHELKELLENAGVAEAAADAMMDVLSASGSLAEVEPVLRSRIPAIFPADEMQECPKAVEELLDLVRHLDNNGAAGHIMVDFSVVNDMSYYNGIVFQGFIEGVPGGVLSGGQYDKLLRKMGRKACAIGFAVYLDFLERFFEKETKTDIDVLLLYDEATDRDLLFRAVRQLADQGWKVSAQHTVPGKLRYGRLMELDREGILREKV